MDFYFFRKQGPIIIALTISFLAFSLFMYETKMAFYPLILFMVALFLLIPYRRESVFVRRFIFLFSALLAIWLIYGLGLTLVPFIIAFLLAYLLDPIVTKISGKYFPRWIASLLTVLIFIGIVTTIAVFVSPLIYSQLDDAIKKISSVVKDVSSFLSSRKFYGMLKTFGIKEDTVKSVIQKEFIPSIEGLLSQVLKALLSLLTSVSVIATQIIDAILIPILFFYFLKDFQKLKQTIRNILTRKNEKLYNDLVRINKIFRVYTSLQILEAGLVATLCSTAFSLFNIPYPIVLGILCGFLNPIPYLGSLASIFICSITVLLVNPDNTLQQIITAVIIILSMHFINAYLIEPNITGKQIGLHPVILIASLFLFSGLFGFIGLMIAVPTTAALMMYFNDWRKNTTESVVKEAVNSLDG